MLLGLLRPPVGRSTTFDQHCIVEHNPSDHQNKSVLGFQGSHAVKLQKFYLEHKTEFFEQMKVNPYPAYEVASLKYYELISEMVCLEDIYRGVGSDCFAFMESIVLHAVFHHLVRDGMLTPSEDMSHLMEHVNLADSIANLSALVGSSM
jgi:hypothetical protein